MPFVITERPYPVRYKAMKNTAFTRLLDKQRMLISRAKSAGLNKSDEAKLIDQMKAQF